MPKSGNVLMPADSFDKLRLLMAMVEANRSAVILRYFASQKRMGHYGSFGISIYFPRSASESYKDPDRDGYRKSNNVKPVSFVKDHQWPEFLEKYLSFNPQ